MLAQRLQITMAAIVCAVIGSAASAATLHVENFADFSNAGGEKSYQNSGFLWDPAQAVNGQCYDAICLNEFNGNNEDPSGIITNITETHIDNEESSTEGLGEFTLQGLYLNYNGAVVNDGENLFSVIVDGVLAMSLDVSTALQDQTWWNGTLGATSVYRENGDILAGSDVIEFGSGGFFFLFDVTDGSFTGEKITMLGLPSGGQMRVDCVALDHAGGTTNLDTSGGVLAAFDNCDPTLNPIPVPASLPLLLTGLLGAGVLARRRRKALT